MAKVRFTAEDVNRGKAFEEAGWHPVKVEKHEEVAAKTDGSALFKYRYKVLDGKYKGVTLFDQFSEKAMGFMIPLARATGTNVGPNGLDNYDTNNPVGKTLEVYVKPEPYEGKMQNKVKDYRPIGAGRVAETPKA